VYRIFRRGGIGEGGSARTGNVLRAGVYVLDREMDADHNRCVITLAGEPDAVGEAAILARAKRWN